MKKIILFLSVSLFFSLQAMAEGSCFIAKENSRILVEEGDCVSRHTPRCTFNIAISLIGYNEGWLVDEDNPELPFHDGYVTWLESWKQPHDPKLWIKNSCVWYSQVLMPQLGVTKFKEYVVKFHYGNEDVSAENALTNAWLSSSLEISPEEQVVFLQNFLDRKFDLKPKAYDMTKKLLFVEELADGWKLYGKGGSGYMRNKAKTKKLDRQLGWFIGWIEKGDSRIIFAHYIEDPKKENTWANFRATSEAKAKLKELVRERE